MVDRDKLFVNVGRTLYAGMIIAEDKLVEITPKAIRLRKMELDENKRLSKRRKVKKLR